MFVSIAKFFSVWVASPKMVVLLDSGSEIHATEQQELGFQRSQSHFSWGQPPLQELCLLPQKQPEEDPGHRIRYYWLFRLLPTSRWGGVVNLKLINSSVLILCSVENFSFREFTPQGLNLTPTWQTAELRVTGAGLGSMWRWAFPGILIYSRSSAFRQNPQTTRRERDQ